MLHGYTAEFHSFIMIYPGNLCIYPPNSYPSIIHPFITNPDFSPWQLPLVWHHTFTVMILSLGTTIKITHVLAVLYSYSFAVYHWNYPQNSAGNSSQPTLNCVFGIWGKTNISTAGCGGLIPGRLYTPSMPKVFCPLKNCINTCGIPAWALFIYLL